MTSDTLPSVSCVIPTHLRGEFLREAIESVQRQSYSPVEIIVASDVLDTDAEAICAELAIESEIPIRYVETPHGKAGASASRNFGASNISADCVAFLDDDDKWDPEFLRSCLALMSHDRVDLVVSWITEFSDEHEKAGHAMVGGLVAADVIAVNPGITGSSFVIRAEVFRELNGFDEDLPIKNDTDFFARFLRAHFKYAVVAKRLVMQRKHRLGQLTAVDERRARGTELYMAKHHQYLSPSDRRQLLQLVHRIRSRSSRTRIARVYHMLWVATLYGPIGLLRKIRRGREREVYEVGRADDGN
ncbi:glycosyltransferase [Microbacterium sp. TS-1]|uniref:glycosyltransferase family 2 protein n=1 Tax=Microbacterium sp. TS-1 TaxID=1344956 RepID=UPI00038F8CC2|nr:glycosyltransferase family 2 protein [Microbacterium sp. TS-1]GAD35034.1 glycosyltransferase [Microbacterium sp. TS-1]